MSADPTPNPNDSDFLKRPNVQRHLRVSEALRRWDPIGVYGLGEDCPEDEYASYELPVIGRLNAGHSRERIVQYLIDVQTQYMGLDAPRDLSKLEQIVDELIEFWKQTRSQS